MIYQERHRHNDFPQKEPISVYAWINVKRLYMATLSALQCNPVIKAFYRKLLAQAKHRKVAITACMRKLITILNTMVKNKTEWAF